MPTNSSLEHATDGVRPSRRLLACIGPESSAAGVVRATHELAATLGADWIAAYVEPPAPLAVRDHQRVSESLRLAEQLGAEVVRLSGESAAHEILRYASERDVAKVLVGRSFRRRWSRLLRPSFVERLLAGDPGIDVYVVSAKASGVVGLSVFPRRVDWRASTAATAAVLVTTLFVLTAFGQTHVSDAVMLYLLCVVLVSLRYGHVAAVVAALLSVAALDFIFVAPYLTFWVADPRDAVTLAVMFVVALIIASLTKRVRDQAEAARNREIRTAAMYAMSRELAGTTGIATMLRIAARHLHDAFECAVAVLLPESGGLQSAVRSPRTFEVDAQDRVVAEWVWQNERAAGWGTDESPQSHALFLLLRGSRGKVGILVLKPSRKRPIDVGLLQLVRTFAAQLGSALERGQLAEAAQRAEVQIETERLRSSLLSSVSHDLRTPLGVITGATSTLLQDDCLLDPEGRRELLESAHEEAERLNRLVGNLLDMTRVAAGALRPKKEWHPLDEIVGVALNRLEARLTGRDVAVTLPTDLPPLPIDAVLIEQVLINLLENALKYTPPGSPISISASGDGSGVQVEVADRGPGVLERERSLIFDKFYRSKPDVSDGGAGLGLAICRGIVEAHGGKIWVEARQPAGASFRFWLPIDGVPPMAGEVWSQTG
jgi:two-component system, OmpR family, sensor histidine kinase KdpD